jgi:hypothetical protein
LIDGIDEQAAFDVAKTLRAKRLLRAHNESIGSRRFVSLPPAGPEIPAAGQAAQLAFDGSVVEKRYLRVLAWADENSIVALQ